MSTKRGKSVPSCAHRSIHMPSLLCSSFSRTPAHAHQYTTSCQSSCANTHPYSPPIRMRHSTSVGALPLLSLPEAKLHPLLILYVLLYPPVVVHYAMGGLNQGYWRFKPSPPDPVVSWTVCCELGRTSSARGSRPHLLLPLLY